MIRTLASHIREFKPYAVLTPLCMVFEVAMEMVVPLMMASIVDKGVTPGDIHHITTMGAWMLVAALLGLVAGLLGAKFASKASAGFARNLRQAMFENIQTFSFANIDKFSTAGLITRLTTDVTNVQMAFMMLLRMCVRAPVSLIVAMVMTFVINAKLATIYLCAVILLGAALMLIMTRAMKYFRQVFERYDALNASVQENISAVRVVKAYVRESEESSKFRTANHNIYKMFVSAEKVITWNFPLMNLTVYACILLISWFGAHMIISQTLTTGELMSLLTYCMNILVSLMLLSMIFVMLTMSVASGNRISEVLNETSDLTNPENPVYDIPNGSVEFRNVSFSYYKTSEKPVLKDISFQVSPGETIGILGATGSAKTSLVNLISRLYDVTGGQVLVGGRDVREYDCESLRNQVSVVLQKNVLFSGTVLQNLRWGNAAASEEECRHACRLACADEFIETLPDGYNTMVEQGGSNFSGGQKQRLCIARALLKQPHVLILDDSTSAVDTATDAKIRKAFAEEIPNTTKFIISQRISSIMHADRILVLDDGNLSGFDTHDRLLETNAIYHDIFVSQSSGNADFDEGGEA